VSPCRDRGSVAFIPGALKKIRKYLPAAIGAWARIEAIFHA
jgi:hypothetical protein